MHHWGPVLNGMPCACSFLALLPCCQEVSSYYLMPVLFACLRAKAMDPFNLGLKSLKLELKPFLKLFVSGVSL